MVFFDVLQAHFSTQPNSIKTELWFHNTENPENDSLWLQFF